MTSFVFIPGAGGSAWYWHLVIAELEHRGHSGLAVQLPAGDDTAGFEEYARVVIGAAAGLQRPVLVAHSLGGFTAPLVCEQLDVQLLVLVNAMVPKPGESAGEWWEASGQVQARARAAAAQSRAAPALSGPDFDPLVEFFHDVPVELIEQAVKLGEPPQSGTPFGPPFPLSGWPDVPTRFLAGREDRIFPIEFQRRVVLERLGLEVDEMPGGHLLSLSQPRELVDRLERYVQESRISA